MALDETLVALPELFSALFLAVGLAYNWVDQHVRWIHI